MFLGGEEAARHSPQHTVSCERITVTRAIARAAAVVVETPVSNHAPVAVGSAHSGLADAVSVGGVADRAVKLEGQGAQRVAVACWGLTKHMRVNYWWFHLWRNIYILLRGGR